MTTKVGNKMLTLRLDAYHAYTTTKSTIINYATAEESIANDDWFREGTGEVRYG
jgi:hypothetical protein